MAPVDKRVVEAFVEGAGVVSVAPIPANEASPPVCGGTVVFGPFNVHCAQLSVESVERLRIDVLHTRFNSAKVQDEDITSMLVLAEGVLARERHFVAIHDLRRCALNP